MSPAKTCAQCSAPLPDDAPAGALCPRCSQAAADRTIVDAPAPTPAVSPTAHETIGDFEILEKLGQGGMGSVYKARDKATGEVVALKVLPSQFEDDPDYVSRFEREAKVAASFQHENLVAVRAYGLADGSHYIAMELVEGENLHQRLEQGTMDYAEALSVTDYVAKGLKCGWETAQLVHRDIKPSNIYLSYDGQVKVGDLGLAKSLTSQTTGITHTGAMMGTPHYMSPEQCRGDKTIDFRADIYSLGCMLFEMLTGHTPYSGSDPIAIARKHLDAPPPALLKEIPNCPLPLALLVGRMVKKAPSERHKSYDELIAEIEGLYREIERGGPLKGTAAAQQAEREAAAAAAAAANRASSARGRGIAIAAVCTILAGAGWWFTQRESTSPAPLQTEGQPATPLVADATSPSAPATPAPMLGPEAPAEIPPLLPEQMAELAKTQPAPYTPAPVPTPAAATPAPATPLPVAGLPAGTVVTLAKDTRVNLRFGASTMPKGARLTLVAVEGQQVRARFGSDLVTVPVADIIAPTIFPAAVKTVALGAATPAPDPLLAATRTSHFTNSLGMRFVPVPGTDVLFCIHETRRKDYAAYAAAAPGVDASWGNRNYNGYTLSDPVDEYPVTFVSWDDAKAFCTWMSVKEGRTYRLPTDREWSVAVGIAKEETWKEDTTPATVFKAKDVFPWGEGWPPPPRAGNFGDESAKAKVPNWTDPAIEGYDDGFPAVAPVMIFPPNPFGIFDLAGNAREWCEDWYDAKKITRVNRGGSWRGGSPAKLSASVRNNGRPDGRGDSLGFRVVVELPRPALTAATSPKAAPPASAATPAPVRKPRTFAVAPKSDFTNTLGMKFIKVRGTNVHFCIHETRHQDYAAFAAEAKGVDGTWTGQVFDGFDLADWPEEHPVANVSWEEARKFCEWLSGKEGKLYRLPTDEEWSHAAGIGRDEKRKKDTTPADVFKNPNEFPWGTRWPPIKGTGNFNDESRTGKRTPDKTDYFGNYDDGFPTTAPVMSFKPNKQDLYDLSGNVWEWCEDWFDINRINRVKRGGSWSNNERGYLLSSARMSSNPGQRWSDTGFRVVMDPTVLVAKVATPAKGATGVPPVKQAGTAGTAVSQSDGWVDILARLTPELVEQTGDGWSMKDGVLHSPPARGLLPLPGILARASYQVRVKVQAHTLGNGFHIALAVGDRSAHFMVDNFGGQYTGLGAVDGKWAKDMPGVVLGRQITDAAPHDLEVTVRLDGANATITTTLDARPLHSWTGPSAVLTVPDWAFKSPGGLGLVAHAPNWIVSEVKVKLLSLAPPPPAIPEPVVAADGWADLLARLTPAIVEQTGNGWSMKDGELFSPTTKWASLPLPGTFASTSYQVRVKLRQTTRKQVFHLTIPVANRMCGFELEGSGKYTGLIAVDGKWGKDLPGVVEGKQINDSEPHDLEVTVRLDGANATITATLDSRPLYEWTGLTAALSQHPAWATTAPGALALGSYESGWAVSAVKAKRLDGSTPPPPLPAAIPGPDGWADLLAPLTPALVAQTGNGWRMEGGVLRSPTTKHAVLHLPGAFAGASYQARVKLRQLTPKESFTFFLPVADRMVGLALDGWPKAGPFSGLNVVNGIGPNQQPGSIAGKRVKDTELHELEVTVRLDGANAKISATLDAQPLCDWAGPAASLSVSAGWLSSPPSTLALGTQADDWIVSEVKVKRLGP